MIAARCAVLRRPLDQIGAQLLTSCITVLVLLGAGAALIQLDLRQDLAMVGAASVALAFLTYSMVKNRFHHRLDVYANGIALTPPPDGLPGPREFLPFAHLRHVGRSGKVLTLVTRDPVADIPAVRTALLSRFRIEDVHDLLTETLLEFDADHSFSRTAETGTDWSIPESAVVVTQCARTLRARFRTKGTVVLELDGRAVFLGEYRDANPLTPMAVTAKSPTTAAEHNAMPAHASIWGVFRGDGHLFAKLEIRSDARFDLQLPGKAGVLELDRPKGEVRWADGSTTTVDASGAPVVLRIDCATPRPQDQMLAVALVWLQWDRLRTVHQTI